MKRLQLKELRELHIFLSFKFICLHVETLALFPQNILYVRFLLLRSEFKWYWYKDSADFDTTRLAFISLHCCALTVF